SGRRGKTRQRPFLCVAPYGSRNMEPGLRAEPGTYSTDFPRFRTLSSRFVLPETAEWAAAQVLEMPINRGFEKGAAGLGGGRPPRTRSGDGEGWGRDRVRVTFCLLSARPSPSRGAGRRARSIRWDWTGTAASRSGSPFRTTARSWRSDYRG